MRRRADAATAVPARLAAYRPGDWDQELTAEESSHYLGGRPPDEDGWERLRCSRWLAGRADWAMENAPGEWPELHAELLRFPV